MAEHDLKKVLQHQAQGRRLGDLLVQLGLIEAEQLMRAVVEVLAGLHAHLRDHPRLRGDLAWLGGPVRRLEDGLGTALAVPLMRRGLARAEGVPLKQAVIESGTERFRAIILTSFTTAAGLMPIMFESSVQAQWIMPMAISLSFGIIFATFITLFLIPSLYVLQIDGFNRIRQFKFWMQDRVDPDLDRDSPIVMQKKGLEP